MLRKFLLITTLFANLTFTQTFQDGLSAYNNFDFKKAFEVLEELSLKGDAQAQFFLAQRYKSGGIVRQDLNKAKDYFELAANQGYAPAQFNLGILYYNGAFGKKDYFKAFEWFEKAANNNDELAQYFMGEIYFNGLRVKQDYAKAKYYLEKAASKGNLASEFMLGNIYYNGLGVEKDYQQAMFWYEKAANQGDLKSQFNLALMYDEGKGVKQDFKKAFEWFEKAAKEGLPEAEYNLGCMYEDGEGVEKDYDKAFYWYEKAARKGFAIAFNSLSYLYYHGKGVKQDLKLAYELKSKANKLELSNKNENEEIEKLGAIFLDETSLIVDKNTKDKVTKIAEELKEKLNVDLYVIATTDNGISSDLLATERIDALNKYYNNIKSHINTSKYILFCIAAEQTYFNIYYSDNLISKDEKREILDLYIIPSIISNETTTIKNKINFSITNGVDKLAQILAKNNNLKLSSIDEDYLNK